MLATASYTQSLLQIRRLQNSSEMLVKISGKGSVDCLEQGNLRLLLPFLPLSPLRIQQEEAMHRHWEACSEVTYEFQAKHFVLVVLNLQHYDTVSSKIADLGNTFYTTAKYRTGSSNVTTAKNTTGGSNASSLTDLIGGLGNSLLQGVGGLLGQVTTGGTTTGGGNASSLTDVLGGLGNSLLQGVGGLLGQVSTGGITTGGGSATLLGDFLGGAGSTIQTKIRKPDTKPVVIRISNPRTLVTALGNYFRAHLLDTINVLFQWIQGRSKELVKEFLDILSMEETVQGAAIEKFLTENTGTIVEGILKFLTEIPDDMGILLLKLIGKHGDALSAYLIECLKGSPFEYAGYIANTTYLLTDIFARKRFGLIVW
nr:unnamed protein product [Spirometra erinaceieuropaei]